MKWATSIAPKFSYKKTHLVIFTTAPFTSRKNLQKNPSVISMILSQLTCEAPNISKEGETQQNHHAVNLLEQNQTRKKTNADWEETHEKRQLEKRSGTTCSTSLVDSLICLKWLLVGQSLQQKKPRKNKAHPFFGKTASLRLSENESDQREFGSVGSLTNGREEP